MASFNAFEYLKNRMNSLDLTEEDIHDFEPYMVNVALSMVKGYEGIIDVVNTKQFFALPKQVQAMAYTSLDGHRLIGKWKLAKRSEVQDSKELIQKVIKVFECTHNDAVAYLRQDLVDMEKLEDMYTRLYEPEKYLEKKRAKSAKK